MASHWAGPLFAELLAAFRSGRRGRGAIAGQPAAARLLRFESSDEYPNPLPAKAAAGPSGSRSGQCRLPNAPGPPSLDDQARSVMAGSRHPRHGSRLPERHGSAAVGTGSRSGRARSQARARPGSSKQQRKAKGEAMQRSRPRRIDAGASAAPKASRPATAKKVGRHPGGVRSVRSGQEPSRTPAKRPGASAVRARAAPAGVLGPRRLPGRPRRDRAQLRLHRGRRPDPRPRRGDHVPRPRHARRRPGAARLHLPAGERRTGSTGSS